MAADLPGVVGVQWCSVLLYGVPKVLPKNFQFFILHILVVLWLCAQRLFLLTMRKILDSQTIFKTEKLSVDIK